MSRSGRCARRPAGAAHPNVRICAKWGPSVSGNLADPAIRYFRGVYSGDTSVVERFAAEDVAMTYPIFARIFDTPVLRGQSAVREFVSGFAQRWIESHLEIHEIVAGENTVVLVWSFRARRASDGTSASPEARTPQSWGGITLLRFDESGRIIAEVGEESEPGPMARLSENRRVAGYHRNAENDTSKRPTR